MDDKESLEKGWNQLQEEQQKIWDEYKKLDVKQQLNSILNDLQNAV